MTESAMDARTRNEPAQPWIAGVCAWIAWRMQWNVLGVRAAALILLWIMPVMTLAVYGLGALAMGLNTEPEEESETGAEPDSPAPSRDPRIDDMERRLAAFDRELERRG